MSNKVWLKMDGINETIPNLTLDNAIFLGFMSMTRTYKILDFISGVEAFKKITKLKEIMDIRLGSIADKDRGKNVRVLKKYYKLCGKLTDTADYFDYKSLPEELVDKMYCAREVIPLWGYFSEFDYGNIETDDRKISKLAHIAKSGMITIDNYLHSISDNLNQREREKEIEKNPLMLAEMRRVDEDVAFLKANFDYENIVGYMEKYKTVDIFDMNTAKSILD